MKYKILIYLIFILKFPIHEIDHETSKLNSFFERDMKFCPQCFGKKMNECKLIEDKLSFSTNLKHSLNLLFGSRQMQYATFKIASNKYVDIVIKYIGKEKIIGDLENHKYWLASEETVNNFNFVSKLKELFSNDSKVDGCQLCPNNSLGKFLKLFDNKLYDFSDLEILLYLNLNVEPLLLSILKGQEFPVPELIKTCGFTIFETNEGEPLTSYRNAQLKVKLEISKQLIKAAYKFTEGFSGFRFYLTDITDDNIVYNDRSKNISFIDLDNVIIVDSRESEIGIHKHDFIECNGCFAYVKEDICAKQISDFNLFAVCQFLREDLYRNKDNGFLGKIPDEFSELSNLLDNCVECSTECDNRLHIGNQILNLINKFLS